MNILALPHSWIPAATETMYAREMVAENLEAIAEAVRNGGKPLSPLAQKQIAEVVRNFAQEVRP